jgi:hypothetical protein
MKIVREELVPAAAAREVDDDFARRGRYATEAEVRAMAASAEARQHLSEADLERLKGAAVETLTAVVADHSDADGARPARRQPDGHQFYNG